MLYLAFAVFSLHILSLPLVVRSRINMDSDAEKGKITVKLFFIPIFVKKMNFDGFKDVLNGVPRADESDGHPRKKSRFVGAVKKFFISVAVRIAERIRVRELNLNSQLGTGDAAATAVTVSSALVIYNQVCAYFGIAADRNAVKPFYEGAKLFVAFDGIISLCFADIIYAVSAQILSKFARRGKGVAYGKHIVAE